MRSGPRINSPECPFCQRELPRPVQGRIGSGSQFDGGVCACGAVFGSDPRGSNMGALIVDVLLFACDGDWDLEWELQADEDYEEAWMYGYHERLHHIVPDTPGPRRGVGTLYLVRTRGERIETARRRLGRGRE